MKTNQDEKIEERLRYILSSVNEWLKFAESKNAALMAASSALIFGILTVIGQSPTLHIGIVYYLYIVVAFLGVGGIICLISFIPRIDIPWLSQLQNTTSNDNLLFYGNIADCSPQSFLKALYQQSGMELHEIDPFEEDYAEQIVVNSRIAIYKYKSFTAGVWFTLAGLITPIGVLLLYLLWRKS